MIYALKDMFEAKRKRLMHLGFMQIGMALNMSLPWDQLFFDWMVSTQYDAYMIDLYLDTGRRKIYQWKGSEKEHDKLMYIMFIPKGATKEEIEMSTRAEFVVS